MAEGLLPPIVLELKAKAGELHAELSKVKTEVGELAEHAEKSGSTFNKGFQSMAGAGKALTFGLGGAAIAVGGFALEAATAGEKVDAQLRTAIKNAGGSMEELEPKIGSVDSKLRGFGYTNEETNAALTRLTVATKDPEKALNAVSVAADLARSRNIPLATATDLVAKAMAGQTGALTRMGISLPVAAGGAQKVTAAQAALQKAQDGVNAVLAKYPDAADKASKGHAAYEKATKTVTDAQKKLQDAQSAGGDILSALEGRVKGAASAYGDTLAGKMAAAKAQVDNIGEALGKRLIPIITDALGAASKFIGWLNDHTPVLYTVAGVIGTVVVLAITAYIASLVKAGVESVKQFAKMIASAAGWVAEQGAALAESTAGFVVWAAQGIGRAVVAAATGFTSMVASAAGWVAEQALQLAESVAGFIAWGVEHAVMAAGFIAENVAMAASATAAFIAENAATLGIVAAIGLIVAGIVWLATHWGEAWDAIKTAAKWAYDNVIKPVGGWITDNVLHPIGSAISWLGGIWSSIWGGIGSAARWVYDNAIRPIGSGIGAVFSGIQAALSWLSGAWSSLWNGIGSALKWVYDHTIGPIVNTIKGAISGVMSAVNGISSVAGKVGSFLGFDNGGIVPGPKGAPMLAVVHGGEYVLSNDMLAGRQQPTDLMKATTTANGWTSASSSSAPPGGGGGGQTINVYATTNADPHRIAADAGWALRAMA